MSFLQLCHNLWPFIGKISYLRIFSTLKGRHFDNFRRILLAFLNLRKADVCAQFHRLSLKQKRFSFEFSSRLGMIESIKLQHGPSSPALKSMTERLRGARKERDDHPLYVGASENRASMILCGNQGRREKRAKT